MVNVVWQGGMAFRSVGRSGNAFVMDAYPEVGGTNAGPTPVEALLGSLATCTAMDVISILQKKKQVVTGYRLEVVGDRSEEGGYPRPFTSFVVRHFLTGRDIDPVAVARAVELSDEKYCTVAATLREAPTIKSEWVVESDVRASIES